MIYLITQMLLCIALALVTGAAVGWLVHRGRHADRVTGLRHTIGQQHAQVQQARTDVSMITQDFDELKNRAQTEIAALRQDNKRLPSLHQNLEKSQLLVRQLMQKHEAQLRDLTQENEQLGVKLSVMEEREAAFAKVRAELESTRTRLAELRSDNVAANTTTTAAAATAASKAKGAAPAAAVSASAPVASPADRPAGSPASDLAPVAMADDAEADHSAVADTSTSQSPLHSAALETPATEHPSATASATASAPAQAQRVASSSERSNWASAPLSDANVNSGASAAEDGADASIGGVGAHALDNMNDAAPVTAATESQAEAESDSAALMRSMGLEFDENEDEIADVLDDAPAAHEIDDQQSEHTPHATDAEQVVESGDEVLAVGEVEFDDDFNDDVNDDTLTEYDPDVEQLFDTVDRRDDLQQIFGIGPITERALNELGITSYSQLADLKRHDIETIADALQIFPGRIERDDWVGNARRQLEDVLEEL